MLIGAYGMFWDRYGVAWAPGSGRRSWAMHGRTGENLPSLRVVDFRFARGVYILYDDYGAYYVGLARSGEGLGGRLKQHLTDKHQHKWDRFSWFAFDSVSEDRNERGLNTVVRRDDPVPPRDDEVIRELEALLIQALGPKGQNVMRFVGAERWEQLWHFEADRYLDKLAASSSD